MENQKILEKIKEINEDIDISEHEVHKFLLIFHTLPETINYQEAREETDGFVTDTILKIVNIIVVLSKNNVDSLNVSAVLKSALSALKKLKSLFIPQTKDTEEGKTGDPEPENGKNSNETQEASKTSRDGGKEK